MSIQLILINDTVYGGNNPRSVLAGKTFDPVASASEITKIQAAGGVFVPTSQPVVNAQQVLAANFHRYKGRSEAELDRLMLAAAIGVYDTQSTPQVTESSADLAETNIFTLSGGGVVVAAYYLPNATSTPGAGSNNDVFLLNIYDNTGTVVGQLCTATLANATPMTKWVRFNLGAITNGLFGDGYTITATITHTGTSVVPAGSWILVTKPTY
jgi:hypothetical protein